MMSNLNDAVDDFRQGKKTAIAGNRLEPADFSGLGRTKSALLQTQA